jgi:RNA polymerase sigma-70 factor (ECF subfamily)
LAQWRDAKSSSTLAIRWSGGIVPADDRFDRVLAAAQAGEQWALAALYRSLQPALLRYLLTRRAGEADDIAAETWISAARGLRRFRGGEDDFRRWIFTIARRRLLDLQRAEARRPQTTPAADPDAGPSSPAAETEALDSIAAREALERIAGLPHDEAEVVLLRVVAGLSAADVGAITGRSAGAVRVLQHRALRRLSSVSGMLGEVLVTLPGTPAM